MPIRKFRRIEDMERAKWREPGDPRLYQTIAALWEFGRRTTGRRFPPGVYRHRSIEELNAQTARWAAMHVRTRATKTGFGREMRG